VDAFKPGGGARTHDASGRLRLDEWLRYAAARLPRLSEEVKTSAANTGAGDDDGGLVFVNRAKVVAKAQEPSLFDFTGTNSPVTFGNAGR